MNRMPSSNARHPLIATAALMIIVSVSVITTGLPINLAVGVQRHDDERGARRPIVGLDHIPFVVRDLAAAADTYRRLGFALKPGRSHANGIINAHVKFEDGSGVELITTPAGVDDVTRHYRALLNSAEGPAFFALHARGSDTFTAALQRAAIPFTTDADGVTTVDLPGLEYVFFVRDNRSPTDRPEHFAHRNGATALVRVWVAPTDSASTLRLLESLGGTATKATVSAPTGAQATVVGVENGDVVILPASHQLVTGRPIVGVTFRIQSVPATARYLTDAGFHVKADADVSGQRRVVVAPLDARGMWLEFREQ